MFLPLVVLFLETGSLSGRNVDEAKGKYPHNTFTIMRMVPIAGEREYREVYLKLLVDVSVCVLRNFKMCFCSPKGDYFAPSYIFDSTTHFLFLPL